MKLSLSKIVITGFVLTALIGSTVYATKDIGAESLPQKVKEESLVSSGAIKYRAFKEKSTDNEIEVNLFIKQNSFNQAALEEYRKKMPQFIKKLHSDGYKKVPAIITLNNPISINSFGDFVQSNKIDVKRFYIRAIDSNGDNITISGIPEGNEIIPQEKLNEFLKSYKLVGIYSVESEISTSDNDFNILQNDKNVFLVDVSKKIIENAMVNSNEFKSLKQKNSKHHVDVNVPDFYWFVEKNK